jgi:hypothetical protein
MGEKIYIPKPSITIHEVLDVDTSKTTEQRHRFVSFLDIVQLLRCGPVGGLLRGLVLRGLSKGQRVKGSKGKRVKGSKGKRGKGEKGKRGKGEKGQRVKGEKV